MGTKQQTTHHTNKTFDTRLFIASIALFALSLVVLFVANMVVAGHKRVPYSGVSTNTVITSGVSALQVTNIQHKPSAIPFVAPKGYEYLVVTLSVQNNDEKPIDVLPTSDTYVKQADGTVSYLAPYALQNPFRGGKILPGESTKGELSYLVPVDGTYKFYVESDWSAAAIPFMIKSDKIEAR